MLYLQQVPVREQQGVAGRLRHLGPHVPPAHRRGDRPARHRPEEPAGGENDPALTQGLHAQRRVLLHLPGRQPGLRRQVGDASGYASTALGLKVTLYHQV